MNHKKKSPKAVAGLMALLLIFAPHITSAQSSDEWEFGLSIYGWFPDIEGTTSFRVDEGVDFTLPINTILDNLDFTLQGLFEARKDHWGFALDMIYMDLGATKNSSVTGTVGSTPIPAEAMASVGLDLKSLVLTGVGYRRFVDEGTSNADFLFGARYLDIEQELNWNFSGNLGGLQLPGREGSARVSGSNTDFIVGLRGNIGLGEAERWFIPYWADIGTGDSDLTWQAMLGLGYVFDWGQLALAWRYLDYDMSSDARIADMTFSGPAIGARFAW